MPITSKFTIRIRLKTSPSFRLQSTLAPSQKIVRTTPDKIVVTEPKFYEAADRIVNDDTFEQLRSWIFVHTLMDSTGFLSDDVRVLGGTFSRALSGAKEAMNPEKAAYHLATARYDQVVGLYYAHKYFGPDAKADVQHMVEKMVAVYKNVLKQTTGSARKQPKSRGQTRCARHQRRLSG